MKRAAVISAALAIAILTPALASANDSEQGPLFIQGGIGFNYWDFPDIGGGLGGYSWTGFRPEIEAGFHFSGRHDGVSLGLRQMFSITGVQGRAAGGSFLRGGYDLAFKVSTFELNVDPYAFLGVEYIFDGLAVFVKAGPSAGIGGGAGVDVKMFFGGGFFAYLRPLELGFQCFHDRGLCAFQYAGGIGAGIALGK